MPFATVSLVVRALGHFSSANGIETWSSGWRIAPITGDVNANPDILAFLQNISADVQTYHTSSAVAAGTATWLTGLTASLVDINGMLFPEGVGIPFSFTYPTPTAGTGTATAPWSQACAVTMLGPILRGRASHGRFFWPAVGLAATASTGRLTSTQINNIATAAAVLIRAINTDAATQLGPGMRVANMSSLGEGVNNQVTSVRVDDRLDTQERRENATPSARASVNI